MSHTPVYVPPSIRSQGLQIFLDTNAEKHNGLGYKQFYLFLESKVNITNIARAFKVSRPTAVNWLEIYHEEKQLQNKAG